MLSGSTPLLAGDRAMFSIQRGYTGREANAIVYSANWLGRGVCWENTASDGTIPVGAVEYCEPLFGAHLRDFYPDFLKPWLCRGIWSYENDHEMKLGMVAPVFIKCATAWKAPVESRLWSAGEILPPGQWWMSDPVTFEQEWRYYVADGSLVTTGWYLGNDEDEPSPKLSVEWPEGFSGAVDFGRLTDGQIALVECHAPFACGWYGDDHTDYAFWQAVAWERRAWWSPANTAIGESHEIPEQVRHVSDP